MEEKALKDLKQIRKLLSELIGTSDLPEKEKFSKAAITKAAKEFRKMAIERGEPEVFGMVLHVYADTFAHKGFSGFFSKENDIIDLNGRNQNILQKTALFFLKNLNRYCPTYGHLQALTFPDDPVAEWEYRFDNTADYMGRLNADVFMEKSIRDNKVDYKEAFECISDKFKLYFKKYPHFRETDFQENPFIRDAFFTELARNITTKVRIFRWRKFLIDNNLFNESDRALKYDDFRWIKEAFPKSYHRDFDYYEVVKTQTPAMNLKDTSWFKFVEGIHWFKKTALELLKDEYEFEIPYPYPQILKNE